MTWLFTAISLVGNVLNSKKIVYGFHVWIICNVGWTYYDFINHIYPRVILDMVQTALCIYGIINWSKREN